MATYITARCLMCGRTYPVEQRGEQSGKMREEPQGEQTEVFICDLCSNRVRFESDEQQKEKKPL